MNEERNKKYFRDTFGEITAPSALVGKVMEMMENENRIAVSINKKVVLLIATAALILLATGAAWIVSSLNVKIYDLGTTDQGYELHVPEADIPEDLRRDLEELKLLNSEDMTEFEREYAVYMYGQTRLEHIAENYGRIYKGRVFYEYFDDIVENEVYYLETGAFYDENGEIFVFCHTNNHSLESHTLVSLLYSDSETKEVKYEYVTFDKVGAYTAVISDDDGWNLEGAFMMFMHNKEPFGGHSGLVPGGYLVEKDYAEFMGKIHTATVDFIDYVLFGAEFSYD